MNRGYRSPARRVPEVSQAKIDQLLTGHDFFGEAFGRGDELDVRAMKRLWKKLKPTLLPDFIAAHAGTRPYAWWRFDSQHPRARLGGVGTAVDPTDFSYWGTPARYQEDYQCSDPPRFESERQYLARLELLTKEEEEALKQT